MMELCRLRGPNSYKISFFINSPLVFKICGHK